jgi:hypothetical protein
MSPTATVLLGLLIVGSAPLHAAARPLLPAAPTSPAKLPDAAAFNASVKKAKESSPRGPVTLLSPEALTALAHTNFQLPPADSSHLPRPDPAAFAPAAGAMMSSTTPPPAPRGLPAAAAAAAIASTASPSTSSNNGHQTPPRHVNFGSHFPSEAGSSMIFGSTPSPQPKSKLCASPVPTTYPGCPK